MNHCAGLLIIIRNTAAASTRHIYVQPRYRLQLVIQVPEPPLPRLSYWRSRSLRITQAPPAIVSPFVSAYSVDHASFCTGYTRCNDYLSTYNRPAADTSFALTSDHHRLARHGSVVAQLLRASGRFARSGEIVYRIKLTDSDERFV